MQYGCLWNQFYCHVVNATTRKCEVVIGARDKEPSALFKVPLQGYFISMLFIFRTGLHQPLRDKQAELNKSHMCSNSNRTRIIAK